MMSALRQLLGRNDMTAYLIMMAPRLVELHRVLKLTGSIYLHCDPTARHFLKLLMDAVFGKENFRTQIVWKRTSAHSDTRQGRKQHGRITDLIFFYTKGKIGLGARSTLRTIKTTSTSSIATSKRTPDEDINSTI